MCESLIEKVEFEEGSRKVKLKTQVISDVNKQSFVKISSIFKSERERLDNMMHKLTNAIEEYFNFLVGQKSNNPLSE